MIPLLATTYVEAQAETPWGVFMLGWAVGWVFSMVMFVLVYAVAGSWKWFLLSPAAD